MNALNIKYLIYVVGNLYHKSITTSTHADSRCIDVKSQAKEKIAAMKNPGPMGEDKGCSSVSESVREQVKKSVCLIKTL